MCTVTVLPTASGFRLACNRDERLDRPPALAPAVHSIDRTLALFPVDPIGGGTWVGVNDSALAVTVLNRTVPGDLRPLPARRRSRGTIGTTALGATHLFAAVERVTALPPDAFDPFTLLIVQGSATAVVTGDGRRLVVKLRPLTGPTLLTSSSLGDATVEGPRRQLFELLVRRTASPLDGQALYHRHQWPDRLAISVDMRRADAATVSRTWIDIDGGRTMLRYESADSDRVAVIQRSGRAPLRTADIGLAS